MINNFLEKIVGKKANNTLSIDDSIFKHNITNLSVSAFIVIGISLYWLIVDFFATSYNLNTICKIGVFGQLLISLYIIIAFKILKKKFSTNELRIIFILYYLIIILGVSFLIYSRNERLILSNGVNKDTGVSVSAFYLFVMTFMPLPNTKDSIFVSIIMVFGLLIPDILAFTSLYSFCCDIVISVCFVVVYFYNRKFLLVEARQQIEINELNNQLSISSYVDSLTKVLNRRSMDEYIKYLCKNADTNSKIGVIIFDIDFFKKYNDYYGHSIADVVLKDLAKLIENFLDPFDGTYLFRYGGEEFVVIMNNVEIEGFTQILVSIRDTVYNANFKREDIKEFNRITISVGGAIEELPNYSGDYISNADLQLYLGKTNNRNAVYFESKMVDYGTYLKIDKSEANINNNYFMSQILADICSDISDICSIDVFTKNITVYRAQGKNIRADLIDNKNDYAFYTNNYVDTYVVGEDKDNLKQQLLFDNMYDKVKHEGKYSLTYSALENGAIKKCKIKFIAQGIGDYINSIIMTIEPVESVNE